MNRILSFFEKQHGISNDMTYDFALRRLRVVKEDSWRGIEPSLYGADYNPEPPLFSAKFANCHNYRHILAIANEDGKIALQDVNVRNDKDTEVALTGQQCHFNAVFDVEWVPGQMKFVSASGDHTARLWEIKESEIIASRVFNGHTRSVKTAAFRKMDSAVFATGGRDGAILIWDTRASLNYNSLTRADNCIYSGHAGGPGTPVSNKKRAKTPKISPNNISSSITGLVFQDDNTLISCGAGDGIIKIWDLRRNYTTFKKEPLPKHSLPYAGSSTFKAFTNLLTDEAGVKLYANCMDNKIYCYNLTSYSTKPIQAYTGFRNSTFYIKSTLSPDGNYLVSGSGDEKAYIWNISSSQPLVTLNGHTVEVTCVAWCATGDMPIVTCSDDARHMVWRIGKEKLNSDDKLNYKGHAEYCEKYRSVHVIDKLKALEHTPRSLRRLVERNEKTPSTVEKTSLKRPFSDISNGDADAESGSDQKRPLYEMTRGRRLFSPSTSQGFRTIPEPRSLSSIIEEETDKIMNPLLETHPDDSSNQENPPMSPSLCNGVSSSVIKAVSPLSERTVFDLNPTENSIASPRPVLSASTSTAASSLLFSPTSNLPNFVIDGEAPHMRIMSPKRKVREKVDWLTKIRKQKMMTCRRAGSTLSEKISPTETSDFASEPSPMEICMSPRLQSLKAAEDSSPKNNTTTPKRRSSRSNSNAELNHGHQHSHQKTPTSARRNSETSILRFFSIRSQSHPTQQSVAVTASVIASTSAQTASK